MQYILEFFDFFKKNEKLNNWKDKVNFIEKVFNEIKIKEPSDFYLLQGENKKDDKYYNLSLYKKNIDIHLMFKEISDNAYEVVDFSEVDFEKMNDDGHYKITKEEYDLYKNLVNDISDFLDEKSEKKFNKSSSFISDEGEINIDKSDIFMDELNYEIEDKKILNEFINNEYEFELKYVLSHNSKDYTRKIEREKLKIKDIRIEYNGGRFYSLIKTTGLLGEECSIWVEPNYKVEYIDISKMKLGERGLLRMDVIEPEITRKQERENIKIYPNVIWYDITPCKYDTIEFLQKIILFLEELNDRLKK